jgi:hypothetical protein
MAFLVTDAPVGLVELAVLLSWNLDQLHHTILDDFVGEVWTSDVNVLSDVYVLGASTSADEVVAPFNARSVIFVYRGRLLLLKLNPRRSRRARRYRTSQQAADAE